MICAVAAALAVANGLQGDPENRVFTCVCTAVFMWVPHLLERLFKHRFSFSQHLAYIVMLTGSAIIGSAFNVFNKVSWYDCLMHGLSGYVMMVFIIIPFGRKLRENEESGKKSSVFTAALLMLLCSLGTACAWEIMEFAVDVLAGQESQGHVPPEVLAQLEAQGITGVAAAWTYGRCVPETKTEKLTFVEDEVPLTGIKDDDIVMTQTGQVFKVVALSGQSVAGKRADDLEKAASARAMV